MDDQRWSGSSWLIFQQLAPHPSRAKADQELPCPWATASCKQRRCNWGHWCTLRLLQTEKEPLFTSCILHTHHAKHDVSTGRQTGRAAQSRRHRHAVKVRSLLLTAVMRGCPRGCLWLALKERNPFREWRPETPSQPLKFAQ